MSAGPSLVGSVERRHDLDALRAFAMLLGIALHAALPYAPGFPWVIRDSQTRDVFAMLFLSIHGFRMPLFFLISGFFTAMIWRQKGLRELLRQRAIRIFIPCLLGTFTILPLMTWIGGRVTVVGEGVVGVEGVREAGVDAGAGVRGEPDPAVLALEAIRARDLLKLSEQISGGVGADAVDPEFGCRLLAWAAMHGDVDASRLLLDSGADLDGRNVDGSTALHCAVFTGHPEVVRLLLDRGADIFAVNGRGEIPVEAARADARSTEFLWGLLGLPGRTPEDVVSGRGASIAMLSAVADGVPGIAVGVRVWVDSVRSGYREFLTASMWQIPSVTGSGEPLNLFFSPVFGHLWFLWFLCWLAVGIALVVTVARCLSVRGSRWLAVAARILTVSRWKLLFVVPTAGAMVLMGLFGPSFGPDTSMGLIPQPHVLFYYGLFFLFGCLYFVADDRDGRTGRFWLLSIGVAMFGLLPAHFAVGESRLASAVIEALYAWLMSFGCLGVFRRFLSHPRVWIRWLSDSSYWLYLTHLPVLFVLQAPLRGLEISPWIKFGGSSVLCTAILLIVYRYGVRYRWLGVLLNGRRRR
ncbi:MAG: Glucans biosynthesis protein [Planctomycetota bacterium]